MIECLPKSLCSWDFSASGLSSGAATLGYHWLAEQGHIFTARTRYEIRKHGPWSGRWTLEQAGAIIAEARKPSAMFRTFEIIFGTARLTVRPETALTRAFEIVTDGEIVGGIRPAHAFTRRATIRCRDSVPEELQLFAFWLVGLAWRRAANHSASA